MAVALATLDLFSGIGGFARGFEATGSIETTCFVEQDPYCQAVLRHHWPDVPILGDIRDVKGCELPIQPDVICGGFPCQPFSQAGKQLAQDDPRHLWPEMFRLIRECRPAWVVGENVAGLIKLGLDEVLSDLEGEGYATRTFNLPACAVGAPHIRQRLWIIAHADSDSEPDKPFDDGAGSGQLGFGFGGSEAPSHGANPNDHGPRRAEKHQQDAQHGEAQLRDKQVRELGQVGQDVADTDDVADTKRGRRGQNREQRGLDKVSRSGAHAKLPIKKSSPDVADTDNADRRRGTKRRQVGDGELELHGEERPANRPEDYWQSEPAVGRLADGIPNRVSQLRALGNTIIPQIAEEIGHAIVAATKG